MTDTGSKKDKPPGAVGVGDTSAGDTSAGDTSAPFLTALISRRRFLAETAKTACGVSLLGLGIGAFAKGIDQLPPTVIRPPGALPEDEFLAACVSTVLQDQRINKKKTPASS